VTACKHFRSINLQYNGKLARAGNAGRRGDLAGQVWALRAIQVRTVWIATPGTVIMQS
jgi:hypothetical protein